MTFLKSVLLVLLTTGILELTTSTSATAAHYVTTPKSLRGTWLTHNSAKHFKHG